MYNLLWCWHFIFQIYRRYRNPREREVPIQMVDDFLATLCFVAMYFENYDKELVIGKVLLIEENHFQVHYWKGTYLGKWSPQQLPYRRKEPWLERLPKTCIACSGFQLSENSKLMPLTRNVLKDRYSALRNFPGHKLKLSWGNLSPKKKRKIIAYNYIWY